MMEHGKTICTERFGVYVGFIFSYFAFTTILYYILVLTHKIPGYWNYLYVMLLTIIIVMVGVVLKRLTR